MWMAWFSFRLPRGLSRCFLFPADDTSSDTSGTPTAVHPYTDDPPFCPLREPTRSRMRRRPTVDQTSLTFGQIPGPPLRRSLARNTHLHGDMSNRTTPSDPFTQDPPASRSQWSVSVHDEPPFWLSDACKHHTTREAQPVTTSTTLRIRTPRHQRTAGTFRSLRKDATVRYSPFVGA